MSQYSVLLHHIQADTSCLHEEPALELPSELHLQAHWFAGQMGRDFTTIDDQPVKIIQFGHWNHAAGPDFLHASVEINGKIYSGSIELERSSSDWEAHGHSQNPSFNDVILHVVFSNDGKESFTRTAENKNIPRILVPEKLTREALNLPLINSASAHPGRCFQPLATMADLDVNSLMLEAARHRMNQKAKRRQRTIDVLGKDEWLWQAIAETLGYRPNKLPMTLLAQRLPIGLLQSMPEEAESMIFGSAGFLSAELHDQATGDTKEYLRDLWETWWRVRLNYEPAKEREIPWKLSGIRPVNHPQRRLAALAQIAHRWSEFSKSCQTINGVTDFIKSLDHHYWNHHYTVKSKRSDRKLALMGADRVKDFQINHLLPTRLANDDTAAWEVFLKAPTPALSEKVDKASIRLFGDTSRRKGYLKKYWHHQALLQVYQDFCLQDVTDCAQCPFPEQLSQWH